MLDIRRIRTEPDEVKAALARRGIDVAAVDEVAELDARQRALTSERDDLRSQIKALSKQVGALHRDGKADEAAAKERAAMVGNDAEWDGDDFVKQSDALARKPTS